MKILSIIYFKRFAQDEMTALFSPEETSDILEQYCGSLMSIRAYVLLSDEPYEPAFTYGSNSYTVENKSTGTRLFYVPAKDVTLFQEANIDLGSR